MRQSEAVCQLINWLDWGPSRTPYSLLGHLSSFSLQCKDCISPKASLLPVYDFSFSKTKECTKNQPKLTIPSWADLPINTWLCSCQRWVYYSADRIWISWKALSRRLHKGSRLWKNRCQQNWVSCSFSWVLRKWRKGGEGAYVDCRVWAI